MADFRDDLGVRLMDNGVYLCDFCKIDLSDGDVIDYKIFGVDNLDEVAKFIRENFTKDESKVVKVINTITEFGECYISDEY